MGVLSKISDSEGTSDGLKVQATHFSSLVLDGPGLTTLVGVTPGLSTLLVGVTTSLPHSPETTPGW